ncbi:hypothetical protein [Microbispora rosea]|uniref:hypothetical protein n=1 Tax=Microbispora rosea TaxID=58117 RepID=UPI0037A10009
MSKALALLLASYTIAEAAHIANFPAGPLRKLAAGQKGWLIDENGRVYDPSQPGYRPQAPDGVALADIRWAADLKTGSATVVALPPAQRPEVSARPTAAPAPVGPQPSDDEDIEVPKKVDNLLARAAEVDDRHVRRALRAAVTALNVLDDQVQVAEERAEAVAAVLEAQRQLAEARARAEKLGVKVPRGKQATSPAATRAAEAAPATRTVPADAAGRDPDKWAPGREPAATPARRYSPGVDYDPKAVREWAAGEGLAFPRNGRFLPGPLVQEYLDAHPQQAAS